MTVSPRLFFLPAALTVSARDQISLSKRTSVLPHVGFLIFCLILATVLPTPARAADEATAAESCEWKAGAASAVITPEQPLRMRGYAARKKPAEGTEQDLFAKALAIEDGNGQRVVLLTMDLIGVLGPLRKDVAGEVQSKYELPDHALLMNASHTHCGPAYGRDEAKPYFNKLSDTLVRLVGRALESLEPAKLTYGHARCGLAMNRRTPTKDGYRNHPNPDGPVDHSVPVLSVQDPEGQRRAVLFGYACHNTTMGFRRWLGDYAGFAQEYFQQDHSGVTAMFLTGCGADQNPYPREL